MIEEPKINRNLALELLRVTEAGALAAAPLQGRGTAVQGRTACRRCRDAPAVHGRICYPRDPWFLPHFMWRSR